MCVCVHKCSRAISANDLLIPPPSSECTVESGKPVPPPDESPEFHQRGACCTRYDLWSIGTNILVFNTDLFHYLYIHVVENSENGFIFVVNSWKLFRCKNF